MMHSIFKDLFVNLTQSVPNFRGIAADGFLGGFSESIYGFNRDRRRQRKGGNEHNRCKNMKVKGLKKVPKFQLKLQCS